MPNQRTIAAALGLTQATVSMALRGDPSIPVSTRQRVSEAAERLGYRPNPLVSTLMGHIRTGRPVQDQGCIAIVFDTASEEILSGFATYRLQLEGYRRHARRRGYATECFFLGAPGMSAARCDRMLEARGIVGVILAPPRHTDVPVEMRWERYACATVSYTWTRPNVDRVSSHHRHNVDIAFTEVQRRGYARIGFCLPEMGVHGVDSNWHAGYLLWQSRLPRARRIPLFVGTPKTVPLRKFRDWYRRWRPDAVIGLMGEESAWLEAMGLRPGTDVGLTCLNLPPGSRLSGVDENNIIIGEKTCAAVVNQIVHNERGIPAHPQSILIEGTWRDGETLPDRRAPRRRSRSLSR